MASFDYVKTTSLKNLFDALEVTKSEGAILAGGTDLLVKIKLGLASYRVVFDINDINDLQGIREHDNSLRIGAGTRISEIADSETVKRWVPSLYMAANQVGSPQVRNRATIGGNILTASPAADTVPPLLAAGSVLTMCGRDGERAVPIESFMTGPGRTSIREGEILVAITVPKLTEGYRSHFIKVGRRRSMAISLVNMAGRLKRGPSEVIEDVSLVLGAVGPTAIRARKAEEYLKGKACSRLIIEEGARLTAEEARPITDIRGTEGGRRSLVEGWTFRLLQVLIKEKKLN